ncbi:hypothetical protein RB595_004014 [Gaeumannomyces hyphopodioides]
MSVPNRLVRRRSPHAATLPILYRSLGSAIAAASSPKTPSRAAATAPAATQAPPATPAAPPRSRTRATLTTLQAANPRNLPEVWFSSTFPLTDIAPPDGGFGKRPEPDERKLKLGKTLRILQKHLPTLLQSPPPQEILAPNISLHLFPSTHQHLPAVSGRVAYMAALWTSPIAWNRVPIVGNVRLEILSERMVNDACAAGRSGPRRQGAVGEQLIVRWRTERGAGSDGGSPGAGGGGSSSLNPFSLFKHEGKEFVGLFIFDFDKEGRILSHTIEHVEEGGNWERGVGAKVVGLTDWLLGGIRNGGRGSQEGPCPAFHRVFPPKGER